MKCNVCSKQWQSYAAYCPSCGSPVLSNRRSRWWEILWVTAALVLLIWLLKFR